MITKKILIVFGTRPEIIKLAPLIKALQDSDLKNQFIVVSTTQHEELLDEQLIYWDIVPDYVLTPSPHKGNLTRLLSHTLSGLQDIIEQVETIEYVITQGDTNSVLACANLAFLNQKKLVHIEAGLRSFDLKNPFPEEFNRIVASRATYFHFTPTEISKNNLLNEGVDSSKIMVIGNTVIDALYLTRGKYENKEKCNTVIITLHRRENIESNYLILTDLILELAHEYPNLNFIWITHPNCAKNIRTQITVTNNIKILEHLPYEYFVKLYSSAKMVITDSGGVSEEAIHLGLPIIIFRKTTERIEALTIQYPMIVSIEKNELHSFFNKNIDKINKIKYSYGEGNASQKILNWLKQEIKQINYDVVIIGGGPAGTGLLLKSIKEGARNNFLNKKIAIIEKSDKLIKGSITKFKVNSDTFSDVFLECLEGATKEVINLNELKDEIDLIKSYKGKSIPLEKLEGYYNKLGDLLKDGLEFGKKCDFIMNSCVNKLVQNENGTYEVFITGNAKSISAKQIIIATGGIPHNITNENIIFSNNIPLVRYQNKIIHSDIILKSGVPDNFKIELDKKPKVVILGGSHSAFSVAHFLLHSKNSCDFSTNGIKIWCNNLPKIYFNTKEEAVSNSYLEFTEDDICPITKKLFRLAGLRMDGRDLYMQMLGLGNSKKETRVKLEVYNNQTRKMEEDLKAATLVILSYGYKFNIFSIHNNEGKRIVLKGESTGHWVNDNCELLDEYNEVITNVYASGLATGFIPSGDLGGEPSFGGQTNGIWYYQNAIAERIINKLEHEHSTNMS